MDTTALVPRNGGNISTLDASALIRAFQQEYSSGWQEEELIQSPRAYNCLRRVLSAVGYEVITEGETLKGGVQRFGTMHVRTEGQNFEVLLESKISQFPEKNGRLESPSPGFTYFHLQGPSEYAQFILDYEQSFRTSRWESVSSHLLLSGAAGVLVMGVLGIADALSSSVNFPLYGYAASGGFSASVSFLISGRITEFTETKRLKEFCEKYSSHLTAEQPLLEALHLSREEKTLADMIKKPLSDFQD